MQVDWYVLHSKPNKESLLGEQLGIRKIETFFPQIRVHPANPRARKLKPYFPGYVFVRLNLDQVGASVLQWLPGAIGFVSYGSQPSMVPDVLIHTIKKRVDEINISGGELFDDLKQGDPVEIRSGPFAGCEAIFDTRLTGDERVRVLLKLLQGKLTKLVISAGSLERKRPV